MSTKYCHCISLASSYQKIHRVRKTWRLYSEQLKEMGGGVYENQEADQGRARRSRARRSRGYVGSEKYVSTACKVRKSCSDTPIQRSPENSMKEWVLTKRLFSGAKWHWGEQNIKERRKMKNSWCSPSKLRLNTLSILSTNEELDKNIREGLVEKRSSRTRNNISKKF